MRLFLHGLLPVALLAGGLVSACSRESAPPAAAPSTPAAATPATAPAPTPAAATPAPAETVFSQEELDQMVAPIALYPDPLLAQVLMAATYPGDVADAVAWSKAHPDAKGDAAVKQVADQPWDPSVQSLVAFPQALATLGQDPTWVQRLGDAFLAQPDDVMDAVQRLRRQAQTAGNLESNEYQNVSVQPAAPQAAPAAEGTTTVVESAPSTIVIQPADPEVVYVPSYNPTTVYGTWAYPSYPPAYYPPPTGYYAGNALASGLAFGVGVAITDSLWGGFDWGDDDIDIDVNRYNNINVNRRIDVNQNTWHHNPAHRDGVPYRDRANRERNGRRLDGADQRTAFRGDDAKRAQARAQARASMQKHGVDAPARSNQEARERAQAAARDHAKPAAGSRDQARERAQAAARDHAKPAAGGRDQAREHAKAAAQRAKADPQAARAKAHAAAQSHPKAASKAKARQTQSNSHARTAARSQAQHHQAPRNNAFQGASKPHASKAAAQRGHASHAAAKRPAASRPAGKPVHRPSHPPQQRHVAARRR